MRVAMMGSAVKQVVGAPARGHGQADGLARLSNVTVALWPRPNIPDREKSFGSDCIRL